MIAMNLVSNIFSSQPSDAREKTFGARPAVFLVILIRYAASSLNRNFTLILVLVFGIPLIAQARYKPCGTEDEGWNKVSPIADWASINVQDGKFELSYPADKFAPSTSTETYPYPNEITVSSTKLISSARAPKLNTLTFRDPSGADRPCTVENEGGIEMFTLSGTLKDFEPPFKKADPFKSRIGNGLSWGWGAEGYGDDYYLFQTESKTVLVIHRKYTCAFTPTKEITELVLSTLKVSGSPHNKSLQRTAPR